MKKKKRNAFYAQSGGVTAVINASACGVIEAVRKNKKYFNKLYAGKNGILGALKQELIDTSYESKKWKTWFVETAKRLSKELDAESTDGNVRAYISSRVMCYLTTFIM